MTTLIVGGGVAGAAAACLLGPAATLVEREAGPHDKVCGEFVSWEAQDALGRLDLDGVALGGAPIGAVRLVHGARVVRGVLPRAGLGLSRRVLDEALLARAALAGAKVLRGHSVRRLVAGGAEVEGVGALYAERTLLATGKHDLRGSRRAARPEELVGLKMYYHLAPGETEALAGHVEVVLFPGGYAGLQPVEGGRANLCLLIQRRAFEEAGATWSGVAAHLARTSPHLARRLHAATPALDRPVAIYRVPYGYVHPSDAPDPQVLRLGDQMGVIPSFSGDGMAIALHTAFAAAGAVGAEAATAGAVGAAAEAVGAEAYHARMAADLGGQIGRAMVLHRMGQAVPGLIAAAARAWPGALALVARLTRVPPARLAWR